MSPHYDDSPRAWRLRDGMIAERSEKIRAAATLGDLESESSRGLSLLGLAAEAGQDARVLSWARALGAAQQEAFRRLGGVR